MSKTYAIQVSLARLGAGFVSALADIDKQPDEKSESYDSDLSPGCFFPLYFGSDPRQHSVILKNPDFSSIVSQHLPLRHDHHVRTVLRLLQQCQHHVLRHAHAACRVPAVTTVVPCDVISTAAAQPAARIRKYSSRQSLWSTISRNTSWITARSSTRIRARATRLLDYVLRVASGEQTKAEKHGCREISIFKDGVVL